MCAYAYGKHSRPRRVNSAALAGKRTRNHARGGGGAYATHLERTAERARGAAGGVRLVPRRLAPRDLAVAAGADLAAGHDELQAPQLRLLLPQHEPADLAAGALAALLPAAVPVSGAASAAAAAMAVGVAAVQLRSRHPHLTHRVHALHLVQSPLPARRRDVLLHDVLGGR